MTRQEALLAGLVRYETGEACRHGHLTYRYVWGGHCAECWRLKRERWRAKRRAAGLVVEKPRPRKGKSASSLARQAAREGGLLTYVGKPCRFGHGGERYVSSATCIDCHLALMASRVHGGGHRRMADDRIATEEQRAKRRAKARRRRARIKLLRACYSAADVNWLREKQGGKCAICLLKIGKLAWEVDHRVSVAAGGSGDRSNLQIAHARCNRQKGKRDEIEFARAKFGRLL